MKCIQVVASIIPKLKILKGFCLSPSHFLVHATSHSGATTLPPLAFYSFQSPSLPLFSPNPSTEKSSPWFLALKGQKQTGSWQASNSMGSGYRGREERQEKGWKAGKKVEGKERKEGGDGKVLCGTFFKAHTDNSTR